MTVYADVPNGSKVIASDRSNYWRYYGLHRDPFMPIVEDSNFFLPARWEQYFDLLQYLCESTNVLLSVVGAKGSGKTTFMRQFIAQVGGNTKICRLVGSTVLTAPQLNETLVKDFNLPKAIGETSEEQWESLCHNMQLGAQPYLLVIDDAHRLPRETLKIILNLIKQQSEHQMRLHVLLIGEIQLSAMLSALQESETDRELIHAITLEPLNLQDTEAYIKHRLIAAGLPGAIPLRPADVARVYKLSEGVPGRINAVTRQVLIDIMQQRQLYGFAHFIRTRRTQFLGGAVILTILLVLAFILTRGNFDPALRLYRLLLSQKTVSPAAPSIDAVAHRFSDDSNNNTSIVKTSKMTVAPTAIINQTQVQRVAPAAAQPLPMQANSVNNEKLKIAQELKPTISNNASESLKNSKNQWYASDMVEFKSSTAKNAASTMPHKTAVVAPSMQQTATVNSALPANEQATALPAISRQNLSSSSKAATASVDQLSKAQPATDKLLTLESPLLGNPKHFTLQLVGAGNPEAVSKFIAKNQLNENQTHYYLTNFHNKNWYAVVYGDYPTRQAALDAVNTLPKTVVELHPWPRTLASVAASLNHGLNNHAAEKNMTTKSDAGKTNENVMAAKKNQGAINEPAQDNGVNIPLIQ